MNEESIEWMGENHRKPTIHASQINIDRSRPTVNFCADGRARSNIPGDGIHYIDDDMRERYRI